MIESNFKKDLEEKIDLYVNGKLNEEQIDELWAELVQDGYYLDYTKSVVNLKAVIEQKNSQKKVAPVYKLRKYANYGTAAAVAIVIGVIGVMNYTGNNSLATIDAQEQLDLGIIRSGGENPTTTNNEIIKEAIELANNGSVDKAINLLENELDGLDSSELIAEMSLTLGSIQYNYGEYDSALINFERVVLQEDINTTLLETAYWYLGNTYFQLEQMEKAKATFQKVYDLNGNYSRIVKTYLDAINASK